MKHRFQYKKKKHKTHINAGKEDAAVCQINSELNIDGQVRKEERIKIETANSWERKMKGK